MATSGTIKTNSHPSNGAYWSFEWTAAPSETERGKTIVSYKIYKRGRTSSPTWLATDCDIEVYYNGDWHTILDTGQRVPSETASNGTSFKNDLEKSGSFTVKHSTDGSGSFKVRISAYIDHGTNWEPNCTGEGTATLDKNQAYTACASPTSVTASGVVKPNGDIKVEWSGQKDGTGNPIESYRIYWKVSSEGTYPDPSKEDYTSSTDIDGDVDTSSATITLKNITDSQRGYKVTFCVWAMGSVSGYNAPTARTGGSVTINTRPPDPSKVTASASVVPSTGGTVKLTVTSGGADADGQTINYYYATSASGTKRKLTSTTSISVDAQTTFYVWAYDSLEHSSSYVTTTVKINVKPTVAISSSGTELVSKNSPTGAIYVINPTINLTKGADGTGTDKYTIKLRYNATNSGSVSSWASVVLQGEGSSATKTINDIRKELGSVFEESGCYYTFSAIRKDGLGEESAEVYDNKIYYVTKIPELANLYNSSSYKYVELSGSKDYFSKILAPTFTYDEGYNSFQFYINNERKATIPLSASSSGNTILGMWEDIDLPSGTYEIKGKIGRAGSEYYSSIFTLKTITKISNISIDNLNAAQIYKAFEIGKTYNYNVRNPFNKAYSSLTTAIYNNFGINDIATSFYARIVYNNIPGTKQNLTIKSNTTSSTIYFDLTSEQLYAMLPTDIKTYDSHTAILEVGFTDVFGASTAVTKNFIVDFLMDPTMSNLSLKVSSNELNTWDYLKEGMPIKFTGTIKSYSPSGTLEILINRKRNNVESGYTTLGLPSFWSASSMSASPGSPISHSYSNQSVITIGKIVDLEYEVNFKIRVKEGDRIFDSEPLYKNFIKVRGHSEQGLVTLNKAEYSSSETTRAASSLSVQYTNTHPGMLTSGDTSNYVASLTCKLQYRNISTSTYEDKNIIDMNTNTLATYLQNSGKTNSFNFTYPSGMDTFVCRLKIETTQTVKHTSGASYTTNYTVYSNEQAVYNTVPTVSYRKNLLGVNTTNFEGYSNAILVVGEHSSKDKIYLVSANGVRTVSVNGNLDGFIIDGGSW